MAQFYTKERSVGNASAKIFDDTQRIVRQSEQLVESMRAVSAYEEKQQASLINNIRAHRQFEKERNTRNHQLLMDNMRQIAEVQEKNDQAKNLERQDKQKAKIAQEERTMQAISELIPAAVQGYSALKDAAKEEVRKNAQNLKHKELLTTPEKYDSEAFGVQTALNSQKDIANNRGIASSIAKAQGEHRSWWSKLFVSDSEVAQIRKEVQFDQAVARLTRGGLEDSFRANPDKTITVQDPNTGQDVTVKYSEIGQLGSSELLNRVYTEAAAEELRPIIGDADPILFHKSYEKMRQYINTRALNYGDKLDRDRINEYDLVKQQSIGLGATPLERANLAIEYITQAQTSPHMTAGQALEIIKNKVMPNDPNPEAFARALGTLEFSHLPGKKISELQFGQELIRESQDTQISYDSRTYKLAVTQGHQIADKAFEASFSDDYKFGFSEYKQSYAAIREQEANRTISFQTARAAEQRLDEYYKDNRNTQLVVTEMKEAYNSGSLNEKDLKQALAAGHIDRDTYNTFLEGIQSIQKTADETGVVYSDKNVLSLVKKLTGDRIGRESISGIPVHFSALEMSYRAMPMFRNLVQKYKGEQYNFSEGKARHQAWLDLQKEILNEEGLFFIDRTNADNPHYPAATTGDGTFSVKGHSDPLLDASFIGQGIKNEGIAVLKTRTYSDLYTNYDLHKSRVEAGLPLQPTAYEQEVVDVSGHSFEDILTMLAEAKGDKLDIPVGTLGFLKDKTKDNPELTRVLKSPKTWNKFSVVIDHTPDVTPPYMGVDRMGFYNARSIAAKLGSPNPEAVAAMWYLQSNGGSKIVSDTPLQQIQKTIEENPRFSMFIDYAQLAQNNPDLGVIMEKYGDSHNSITGASKSIARLSSQLGPSDMSRGAQSLRSSYGFPERGAAYLAGNIQQESGWYGQRKPWDDVGAPAGGIVSWRADRLTAIENYYGKPISKMSNKEQMDYMVHEMRTKYPEEYQVFMDPNSTDSQLKQASMGYWGYGDEGARYTFADQLLNKNE
tara:strand:+ start:4188 stop:7223 length:3036 start_codon:yes stop_codon:yes gene_type:complete